MENDDPVVEEIPVFLSQALSNNLHLYQYNTWPAHRDWTVNDVKSATVKPKSNLVQLEVGLDTNSENYDLSYGEQIAQDTDGFQESTNFIANKSQEKPKDKYFKNGLMDKMIYKNSTYKHKCYEQCAVAILQDKELHCTPVKGFVYANPSLSYFDKQEIKKQEKNKADTDDKKPEPQQVTVKFARQETKEAKKARDNSLDALAQRIAQEPWYEAEWRHSATGLAELEHLKLFSAMSVGGPVLSLNPQQYLNELAVTETSSHTYATPQEQIKGILLRAQLVSFNELRQVVRTKEGPVNDSVILTYLSNNACCVQGLWTPQSSTLYDQLGPAPKELMCIARDHILYLFSKEAPVDREKVTQAVRLPPEIVLEMLESIAQYNRDLCVWKLRIPRDKAFEDKHSDLMQRQNLYLEARERLFRENLSENIPKRQRKKSQRESVNSDTMLSPRSRCNSVVEEDDRKRQKNKPVSVSGKRARKISSSSAM